MAEKTKEVGVRLSVKDADVAKRALAAFGDEGAGALKRIEAAASPASGKLTLLSNGIQRTKEYARDFAVEGARSFLGPIIAITSATAAIELMKGAIEDVKKVAELGDLSERLGVTVDKLQGLQDTFREGGHDVGELNNALQTFAVNLANLDSPLAKVFAANDVKITGDTFTDLQHYADLVRNARNEQDKLRLTTLAFGKGSKEMADLVSQGGDAIAHAADEAHRLGAALDDVDIEKARQTEEKLAEVNIKLDQAKEKFGLLIAPAEIALLNDFNDALSQTNDLLGAIQNLDVKKIAGILGRDDGDHPSLFGKNGMFAIDWFGDGSAVTGNRSLVNPPRNVSGGPDSRGSGDHVAPSSFDFTQFFGGGAGSTKLPSSLDDQSARLANEAKKRIEDVKTALQQQLDVLGKTDREQAIANELSKAHITTASKEAPAIEDLAGKLYDQKRALDATNEATSFLAQTGETAFESLIDGTSSWQDVLGDTIKTLEKAVIQAELLGSGPLAGILGTASGTSGQTGGLFGQIISAFTSSASAALPIGGTGGYYPGLTGPSLAGARAGGGPVDPGSAYLVGENGPELFMPRRGGSIVPNSKLGGSSVQVNVQIIKGASEDRVTQSRGADGSINIKAFIKGAVSEDLASGKHDAVLASSFGLRRKGRG